MFVSCYAGVFLNFVPKFAGLTIISTRDNLYSYPNRSILVSESQTKTLFSETKKSFCNCLAWFVLYWNASDSLSFWEKFHACTAKYFMKKASAFECCVFVHQLLFCTEKNECACCMSTSHRVVCVQNTQFNEMVMISLIYQAMSNSYQGT